VFIGVGVADAFGELGRTKRSLADGPLDAVNFDVKLVERLHGIDDFADTNVAFAWDVHENALAGSELVQRLDVPLATTGGNETVLDGVFPGASLADTEGDVVVPAVPWLPRFRRGVCGVGLGWIDEPCACEVVATVVVEVAEEGNVDGNAEGLGEVIDDAFRGVIEFAGDDEELVVLVERVRRAATERVSEGFFKVLVGEMAVACVRSVDVGDALVAEGLDPTRVVEGLSDDVSGRPVALDLDDDEVAGRIDRKQVDVLPVVGEDLPADDEQVGVEQADVGFDGGLKVGLEGRRRRRQFARALVYAPYS